MQHIRGAINVETIVRKINIPCDKRIIVTSDIHGHYNHLKNLLAKVNFTEEDVLFIVGDMIEKGPFSLKTLRYIMELDSKYTVYPMMGNVDAARLLMLGDSEERIFEYIKTMRKNWGGCLFEDMCKELEIEISNITDISRMKKAIQINFKDELDFLRNLPTIIETQNYIFVHGGLPSNDLDSFQGTDIFPYLKNDAFMEKGLEFNKYVVVGHWPVTLYNDKFPSANPIIDKKRKIISMDGGCGLKLDGQLNAIIIKTMDSEDITFEAYDDFPVVFAETPQKPSKDSINIRYIDNKVKIIKKTEEFSYAEHKSSGRRLWILNDFIYSFDENAKCEDCTDYLVPVNIGDKLSLVKKTSKGYFVKKDGVSGWYKGIISDTSLQIK